MDTTANPARRTGADRVPLRARTLPWVVVCAWLASVPLVLHVLRSPAGRVARGDAAWCSLSTVRIAQ